MISKSDPWKREIEHHRSLISRWAARVATDRGYFLVERGIYVSAFAVRKLIENQKITDRTRDRAVEREAFLPFRPLSDRAAKFFGVSNIADEYDLAHPSIGRISPFDLCSEIIHSYVFTPEIDQEERMTAFFINSYRGRDGRLLRIQLRDYTALLSSCILDRIEEAHVWKDGAGKIHSRLK